MNKARKTEALVIEPANRKQFILELCLALVITGLACSAGFSNFLTASNALFPLTSDAMGHMAKVRYIAESIADGVFPTWFPFWYSGTAVAQYYPPLSYWIMAPVFLAVQNAMLTYKIYCFSMFFIGGMGVWTFSRIYIGNWCGLFGTAAYCLQPYILLTLLEQGQLAQGPIIALAPWFLIALLAYTKDSRARNFALCTVVCSLMILSHPNSVFMFSLCIMSAFAVFLVMKKISFRIFCYMGFSMAFALAITAFWSLVGVTQFETPGVPALLEEVALINTATVSWFTGNAPAGSLYFGIPITIASLAAILQFAYRASIKRLNKNESFFVLFIILLTLFTGAFSFGLRLPLFEYLPMARSFMAGRILTLTSASGAILCAYLIYGIVRSAKGKRVSIKSFTYLICFLSIAAVLFYMNPFEKQYYIVSKDKFDEMILKGDTDESYFEKGRYATMGIVESTETYFPLTHHYNLSGGWNIEGTPHNKALWSESIARVSDSFDYLAKNFAFWNVRFLYIDKDASEIINELNKKYSFVYQASRNKREYYVSGTPSSYFLIDHRNALVLGSVSPGLAMEFPYLIQGRSENLLDYSLGELEKYKLIYLYEPKVGTIREKEKLETRIEKLVNKGITVVIEPEIGNFSLFNITASDVSREDHAVVQRQKDSLIESSVARIEVGKDMLYYRVLFGLDDVYYKLNQNDGRMQNDVIGAKKVGNGEVIFIGMQFSHYLKAVYTRNWGVQKGTEYPDCTDEVNTLYEDIFKTYSVAKDFWPDSFPVIKADWNYKGVDFKYTSPAAKEMTLSVTYSPRWKATLDGKLIPVGQKENLITLGLPAGEHEVKLVYGITKYGIAGYIISLLGLLFFILFLKFYDIINYHFRQICTKTGNFLQMSHGE